MSLMSLSSFVLTGILIILMSFSALAMPQITSDVKTEFAVYTPYISDVVPNVPAYVIKAGLTNVTNADQFQFTDTEKALLVKNGFFANTNQFKQIYDVYNFCQRMEIPVFVTTDSMLHVYHILYDYSLRIMETRELYYDLERLNKAMLSLAISQYENATDPLAVLAAEKNVAYFTVANVLLNPSTQIPPQVRELVDAELELIDAHQGFSPSPIFGYMEDYSQYVPRGHYTRSDTLKRFFKSMMWYGRIAFRVSPREGKEKGLEETLQAVLIVASIAKDNALVETWDRIYEPTAFFVGKADDLNVHEYMTLVAEVYGNDFDSLSPDELADSVKLEAFVEVAKEMRSPMISSSWVWEGEDIGEVTKGFRFMGQRFIPDSYMFQQLVHDAVNGRLFPKGLDVMAIMGSERAYDILIGIYNEDQYPRYTSQMAKLSQAFADMDDEVWAQNLYWNWLYVLMPLLTPKGKGYPIFMQNQAWTDKELATALGSWAELRHDTILYAKQSYTKETAIPSGPQLIKGYVEPNPEVYARLAALVRFSMDGLSNRGLLLPEFASKFSQLEELLISLKEISELELANQPLSTEQYGLIANIGGTLETITKFSPEIASEIEGQEDKEMAVIADVHTDNNTGEVLEEGVGYPLNIFAVVPIDGELRITQGALFSYYEFTQSMSNRLTDGQWQEILKTNPPDLPIWMGSYMNLAESQQIGERYNFEQEMPWQPTEMTVTIKPEIIEAGDTIEINARISGKLDNPPLIILKQADVTIKGEMEIERDDFFTVTYIGAMETESLKAGSAQITITGNLGEEKIVHTEEVFIVKSSAVNDAGDSTKHPGIKTVLENKVHKSYPNPFNPDVWIPYELKHGENVTIQIYNTLGQLIRTLEMGYKPSGSYLDADKAAHWDGRNANGEKVPSGIYFYTLQAGDFIATGKMIAVK